MGIAVTEHTTRTQVTFECGHKRVFPAPTPKVGEILWCPQCAKDVKVMFAPDEWRIRCTGCIYSRPFGAAQLNAEISAAKHRMKHPDHAVRIYNGAKLVKTFGDLRDRTVTPMIPGCDQIPGF